MLGTPDPLLVSEIPFLLEFFTDSFQNKRNWVSANPVLSWSRISKLKEQVSQFCESSSTGSDQNCTKLTRDGQVISAQGPEVVVYKNERTKQHFNIRNSIPMRTNTKMFLNSNNYSTTPLNNLE